MIIKPPKQALRGGISNLQNLLPYTYMYAPYTHTCKRNTSTLMCSKAFSHTCIVMDYTELYTCPACTCSHLHAYPVCVLVFVCVVNTAPRHAEWRSQLCANKLCQWLGLAIKLAHGWRHTAQPQPSQNGSSSSSELKIEPDVSAACTVESWKLCYLFISLHFPLPFSFLVSFPSLSTEGIIHEWRYCNFISK